MEGDICKLYIREGVNIKISKEFTQFNIKKKKKKKNQAVDLNRYFSKIQMANRHMKRCSASLITREMHIKTIMSHHLTPERMAMIKQSK